MQRQIFLFIVGMSLVIILIPSLLVLGFKQGGQVEEAAARQETIRLDPEAGEPLVTVYLSQEKRVIQVPLEQYVRGVVAAEMPIDFELEALKAQAIASRTYIVQRLILGDFSDVPAGAMVSDTVQHQAYLDENTLRARWGLAYEKNMAKLTKAVAETRGKVITYKGKPIYATFFSTSNGYTENAHEYWHGNALPYLKSVPSPWDARSPKFQATVKLPLEKFLAKLSLKPEVTATTDGRPWIEVVSKTTGHRVKEVRIGDKLFSGREIREALGLNSSDFTVRVNGDELEFTTNGYGHGVGMSQYGADGMAKEGKKAEEIIRYYYQGVELQDYRQWIKQTAKNDSQN
ncbi:MAG: stage II sporulation protein D [Bacillus thermozeamaize]|uniref:Stage II sporulation protein D n=1 Tax=Bacillus thermozeamaize TaxID=230954 RepID=A0A1Y3PAC5_9BACI|nr:MAG: stage II sporulation protein D [Bacillus thermozeamaize]